MYDIEVSIGRAEGTSSKQRRLSSIYRRTPLMHFLIHHLMHPLVYHPRHVMNLMGPLILPLMYLGFHLIHLVLRGDVGTDVLHVLRTSFVCRKRLCLP